MGANQFHELYKQHSTSETWIEQVKGSFIITTNKSPEDWVIMLEDEVIATALLDRLLYRCEIVSLSGTSYRLKNRKVIFS